LKSGSFTKKGLSFVTYLPSVLLSISVLLSAYQATGQLSPHHSAVDHASIPVDIVEPYVVMDNGRPDFPDADKTSVSFERYSELDDLGRPGPAYASVGLETMPTEPRGEIGQVTPAGWHTIRYDFIDGGYLYNRCHLIGYQLTAENANEKNLITGTRYLNVTGMLPFENLVADYVKETTNHVLYRVTPIYHGTDLVASGVEMEAWSVEDEGDRVCFDVYVYNIQPGVTIDYATGDSWPDGTFPEETPSVQPSVPEEDTTYILNESSKKFHLPDCPGVKRLNEKNRRDTNASREVLIQQGYSPCGICDP